MKNFSLKSKIYTGFAVIACLLLLIGCVSYFGQSRLANSISSLQQINSINSNVLELDRDVQKLQLRVDRFVTTGHDSLSDEVRKIHERISSHIKKAKSETDDGEIVGLYEMIESHTEVYGLQFDSVVKERRLRKTLVEDELPQQASLVQEKLDELSKLIDDKSFSEDSLNLVKAQASFSQAERSLLRYFAKPNSKRVNEMTSYTKSATMSIQEIKTTSELKDEVVEELDEFERIGIRAVQATRSYLFFQNVVMSGEQSEVNFFRKKTQRASKRKTRQHFCFRRFDDPKRNSAHRDHNGLRNHTFAARCGSLYLLGVATNCRPDIDVRATRQR